MSKAMYYRFSIIFVTIVMTSNWNVQSVEGESCSNDKGCTGVYRKCCNRKCIMRKYCDNYCLYTKDCAQKETCVNKKCMKSCTYTHDCVWQGYKACCDKICSLRKYCHNFCQSKDDCTPEEYCIGKKCTKTLPLNYCDSMHDCSSNQDCKDSLCVSKCNCGHNEECIGGKCEKESSSFSTASIVGFMVVVIVGSCIACVVYCGCARTAGRQTRQPQQQQQQQQHLQLSTRGTGSDVIPETTGEPESPPILPGGPPPYHSLERLDGTAELPPPPTYAEAVRDSHKTLNVV